MTAGEIEPKIDVVLGGYGLNTDVGLAAFCAVVLIEAANEIGELKRILVDPAHVGRRTFLWEALARRGLGPTDIDAVVLTHAHWDHVQNIDVFDHAPLMLHPDERAYSLAPHRNDWATPAWTGAMLERQRLVEVVGGDELLPGVRIVDMPGHTPGSIGVAVETKSGLSVITGDALHYAPVALSRQNPLVFWDASQAKDSIDRVVEMADVIYPGHDRAFRVTKDREIEYLQPFELTIRNVAPSTPGLRFESPPRTQWVMPAAEEQTAAREAFKAAAKERALPRKDVLRE